MAQKGTLPGPQKTLKSKKFKKAIFRPFMGLHLRILKAILGKSGALPPNFTSRENFVPECILNSDIFSLNAH